jgi:uncharacterized integral membrane protein (TIGR00698 family)
MSKLSLPTLPATISSAAQSPASGLLLVALLALGANTLSTVEIPLLGPGVRRLLDPVLLAMIAGIAAGNLAAFPSALTPGIRVAARKLLPVGIVLLGARLDFAALFRVGLTGVLLSVAVVGSSFIIFHLLRKPLQLERTESLLLAIGTGICGGTAIVALAPLLGAPQRHVVTSVAVVTLVGLAAMVLLPVVGALAGLSPWEYGVWTGLTVHQTPQVIAAGFAYGVEAGETATVVKLGRVCLLAPVAVAMAWAMRTGAPAVGVGARLIPGFVLGFVGMALARTAGLLPDVELQWSTPLLAGPLAAELSVPDLLARVALFLLAMAMAAIGMETKLAALRAHGLRGIAAGGLVSLVIAAGTFLTVIALSR